MKYRIIEMNDGYFQIQHKRFFVWWTHYEFDFIANRHFRVSFKTKEGALAYIKELEEDNKSLKIVNTYEVKYDN